MEDIKIFIICLIWLNINLNLSYAQVICKNYEWKCKNGQCIARDELCDGESHCLDSSDETSESCLGVRCPSFSFRCSYGACVSGNVICNNIKDCIDNSDEVPSLCPGVASTTTKGCSGELFSCDNGECIKIELQCDGKKDCSDGSDETVQLCSASYCPAFAFRCAYGACISGENQCNGVNDCFDGSDESRSLCGDPNTTKRPETTSPPTSTLVHTTPLGPTQGCRITYMPNLIVTSVDNKTILPGDYVVDGEQVSYSCNKRHALKGVTDNYCFGTDWSGSIPTCTKYCSNSVLQSITIQSTCDRNGYRVECNSPLLPDTRAIISCNFGYSRPLFDVRDIINCNSEAEWDYLPYRCEQVCGQVHPSFSPFIANGEKVNNTKVPWHVGIYSSLRIPNEQICGGTIVSARIVISAAHCFWNVTNRKLNDIKYYKIGAGKYYRAFDAVEILETQFSDVAEIHITNGYKNAQLYYIQDIAVLALKIYLKFTYYIQPACLQWTEYSQKQMKSNIVGRVAGWGKTANGTASIELNTIELSTLSNDDCVNQTIPEQQNLITGDKFCVSGKDGATVCEGDSGGGFLVPIMVNGIQKFVLQGIVSNGINSNSKCTGDFLTAYTNIQYFKEMIVTKMNQYKIE